MNKKLCYITFFICFLVIIGLSIWLGFPKPANFNRSYICVVGYMFSIFFMTTSIVCCVEVGKDEYI